jgi:hypothetical protein
VPAVRRPLGVAILAILVVLGGVLLVLAGAAVLFLSGAAALADLGVLGLAGAVLGGALLIFGLIWLAVGFGLWNLRSWAWWLAVIVMVLSIIGGIGAPVTIVIPALILVYLLVVRNHFR